LRDGVSSFFFKTIYIMVNSLFDKIDIHVVLTFVSISARRVLADAKIFKNICKY